MSWRTDQLAVANLACNRQLVGAVLSENRWVDLALGVPTYAAFLNKVAYCAERPTRV